jgi:adenine/guanine phosphoribosyltransferase-like PRPP-binding protein
MDAVAGTERIVALIGAIVVGVFAVIALKNDWNKPGLDNNTTKLLLGLMAFGCVLVFFAAIGVLGPKG